MLHDQEKELSRDLVQKFHEFLTLHSPSAFNRRLRELLLEYIILKQKLGFPVHFNVQLLELSDLFELMDAASDEFNKN